MLFIFIWIVFFNIFINIIHTKQTFVGLQEVLKTSQRHVLKTSSARPQRNNFLSSNTSWRHLEDDLEDEKLLPWRRLQDFLKTSWRRLEDVLKTCPEDVLKTFFQDVLKTSSRQTKYLQGISVSSKLKCVSNNSIFRKSISDKSRMNPKSLITKQ